MYQGRTAAQGGLCFGEHLFAFFPFVHHSRNEADLKKGMKTWA
jgi:hypothetical protein